MNNIRDEIISNLKVENKGNIMEISSYCFSPIHKNIKYEFSTETDYLVLDLNEIVNSMIYDAFRSIAEE